MTPQILQQLNGSAIPNLTPIREMMQMVKGAQNPAAMMQMLAQRNPQLQQALTFVQQAGRAPEQLYYTLCQQRGVNPQTILDELKKSM